MYNEPHRRCQHAEGPIHRLRVQAFARSEAGEGLIRETFADRRLSLVPVDLYTGGIDEAVRLYAGSPSPELLIIELADADDALSRLEALAGVCQVGTDLILIGWVNDVRFYRTLTDKGVADYIVLPADLQQLADAVLRIIDDTTRKPGGKLVAFMAARGGCGSSTLAHNTAHALTKAVSRDVLLVDLDLAFGSADITFDIEPNQGVANMIAEPERIDAVFLRRQAFTYGERLHVLPTPADLELATDPDPKTLRRSIDPLRAHARFIVLDLPRRWSPWVSTVARIADEVVLVAAADLASMRNARNLLDQLRVIRTHDQPPLLLLNRIGRSRYGEIGRKDFEKHIGQDVADVLAEDAETFGKALTYGKTILDTRPRSKAARAVTRLAELICERCEALPLPAASKPARWGLARLFRKRTP